MIKQNWFIYNKKADFNKIASSYNISNVTARILCNRGISEKDIKYILSDDLNLFHDENLLSDINKATEFLKNRIDNKKKIRIVGDYDVDGICSTYILYDALKKLNADVSFKIPDRVKDGYGINKNIIKEAIDDNIDTILTCDNGISANEEIKFAKENNINVIITDHHDIQDLSNEAIAIVNPKRIDLENKYPFTEICGAFVCLKFIKKLFSLYENINLNYEDYIPFATMATICDVMPIINENHILVKNGLKYIKKTKNIGLRKLLEINSLTDKDLNYFDIGFIIGPSLNASGRLKTADLAMELFNCDDEVRALQIANDLKNTNDERKKLTDNGEKFAINQIENYFNNDKIFVLYLEGINESVAGIVAGRIKDKFNKPTIILTESSEDNIIKASCRSIPNFDIFNALSEYKNIFEKFGGHKLAAGFSMDKKYLELLRDNLNKNCILTDSDFDKKIMIDLELPLKYINQKLIDDFMKLEPFGNGLEKPIFGTKNVSMKLLKSYGQKNNVLKIQLKNEDFSMVGTMFLEEKEYFEKTKSADLFNIIYNLSINYYNNEKYVNLVIKDFKIKK